MNRLYALGAAVVLAASLWGVSAQALAQEIPLVTGEHWMKSTEEMKKAYLIGIANIVVVELAYAGTPPSEAQSVLPRMVRGLRGHTLDTVRDNLNRWYTANPDRLQRPVVETIWFELVVPGLKRNPS